MYSNKKVSFGLIGCGYWGPNFIRLLQNAPENVLVKVCDTDKTKTSDLQKKFPDVLFTDNADEIINDPAIDAIIICTPVTTHYEITKRALLAGKHVLCEKPLSDLAEHCTELENISAQAGKQLLVGHVFEYNANCVYMKQLVHQNNIGEILYLQFTRTNMGPMRKDVNVVYDLASHDVSMAISFLGTMPIAVTATGKCFIQKHIEDIAFIQLEFPGNITVCINVSWMDAVKQRIVKIAGSKKVLLFDDVLANNKLKIIETGKDYHTNAGDLESLQLSMSDYEVVIPAIINSEPLRNELNHFINCIHGTERPLTGVSHARQVVEILGHIQTSIKNNGAKIVIT